jgi:hypothetical protein
MNIGDIVRFNAINDFNIPYKSIGEVKSINDWEVEVQFNGLYHNNKNKQSDVWTCYIDNLSVEHTRPSRNFSLVDVKTSLKSSEKPSDNPTLTIPLVKGIESFTGQFEDSEGNVYSVSVDKLPLMRQK